MSRTRPLDKYDYLTCVHFRYEIEIIDNACRVHNFEYNIANRKGDFKRIFTLHLRTFINTIGYNNFFSIFSAKNMAPYFKDNKSIETEDRVVQFLNLSDLNLESYFKEHNSIKIDQEDTLSINMKIVTICS